MKHNDPVKESRNIFWILLGCLMIAFLLAVLLPSDWTGVPTMVVLALGICTAVFGLITRSGSKGLWEFVLACMSLAGFIRLIVFLQAINFCPIVIRWVS